MVNEGVDDQNFTGGTSNVSSIVNENALNVKTLERCFNERIDREMSNIVDTVEDRIQNAILVAIDNIIAPKIELAIRSINASSGRDVTSVSGNSERRDHERMNTSFGSASENNGTLGMTNANDETRCHPHDRVGELSVAGTQFDQQSPAHHVVSGGSTENHHTNRKCFLLKPTMFSSKSKKLSQNYRFFKQDSKQTAHVECSLDNMSKVFCATSKKTSLEVQKKILIAECFSKRFCPKCSCLNTDLGFDSVDG